MDCLTGGRTQKRGTGRTKTCLRSNCFCLDRSVTLEEDGRLMTYISCDVHRKFFHQYVKFGATVLYPLHVSVPHMVEELRDCKEGYDVAGFPGCIGSTDATHIPLEKVCVLFW
jgi:hypothetical protein